MASGVNTDSSAVVDVIGVCKTVDEVTRLTTKTNREVSKRTIGLMDMSGKLVTVTLWGEEVSTANKKCQKFLYTTLVLWTIMANKRCHMSVTLSHSKAVKHKQVY